WSAPDEAGSPRPRRDPGIVPRAPRLSVQRRAVRASSGSRRTQRPGDDQPRERRSGHVRALGQRRQSMATATARNAVDLHGPRGLEGAKAGIAMLAEPRPGTPSYAQGWGPSVNWSDRASVYDTGSQTCVPAACYRDVLVTDEFNRDERGAHQLKYYAPGVGG